ncbi:MAG: carbohydrate-binding family 9-like protein [Myxococcaceae bacterium]
MAQRRFLLALFTAAALISCRDEQAGPKKKASQPTQPRFLEAAPAELSHRSGATWGGGAVTYLGSNVSPAKPKPGDNVTLTHYFRAERAPPQGYGFFVHVLDASNSQFLANLDHEVQGGAAPLGTWKPGKIVEDTHSFRLPPQLGMDLRFALGFWQGDSRLPVDAADANVGENRMAGPLVSAGLSPPPEYRVKKVERAPKIDGVLDDAIWKEATPVELVTSYDGRKPSLRTTARIVRDDEGLYVAFDCEDPDVWGTLLTRDADIYNQEVVEVFLDANGDGRTYNELEVSPHNVIFDAYFPARRQGMDLTFDAKMETAVKVRGTLDNAGDRDEGWSVELKIPFAPLAEVPHRPPQSGDRWRFNLYRLEHLDRKNVEGQAFSPLFIGDFHHLPRFGWLVF